MPKGSWKLYGLNLHDLAKLRDQVEGALERKIADERAELEARLDQLSGVRGPRTPRTANGIRSASGRKAHPLKGRKAPIKYRGPNGEKWSGRGLAPRWLSALEAKGKKRESFLIK